MSSFLHEIPSPEAVAQLYLIYLLKVVMFNRFLYVYQRGTAMHLAGDGSTSPGNLPFQDRPRRGHGIVHADSSPAALEMDHPQNH
jgi:hypothetical protein